MDPLSDKLAQAERQIQAGQAAQALASLQRLLPKHPGHAALAGIAAHALLTLDKPEQAIYYARRSVDLTPPPGDPKALTNLGILLAATRGLDSRDEALALFEKALALSPRNTDARIGITNILMERSQWARAEEVCRAAMEFGIHDRLVLTHAAALVSLGRLRESMELMARATQAFPDHVRVRSGLASTAIYLSEAHPAEIARLFRDFGRVLEKQTPRLPPIAVGPADAARPLRVGILSPDLRTHSVAFFIEPFIEHHDRSALTVAAYMTTRSEDATSDRLRAHCALWRNVAGVKDDALAQRIREDKIDVLLDLAGHTQGHKLAVLARRPAPLQVTYLGFPDTTGLTGVDWRIVDSHTDPVGTVPAIGGDPQPSFDERATEKLWRLDPSFLCFRPPAGFPEPRRNAHNGGVVFASFNAARKISVDCIGLWSRILRAVEGSTLTLKAVEFADPEGSRVLADAFAREGLAGRVQFLPPQASLEAHLAMYIDVDVALDTYPYHGTTTTCEALWMGVPVVTLAGDRHAARVGVSLLTNIGATEWIAKTPEHFVEIATTLVRDTAALDRHRRTLRARLAASPICDQPAFAQRLSAALRSMWAQSCGVIQ